MNKYLKIFILIFFIINSLIFLSCGSDIEKPSMIYLNLPQKIKIYVSDFSFTGSEELTGKKADDTTTKIAKEKFLEILKDSSGFVFIKDEDLVGVKPLYPEKKEISQKEKDILAKNDTEEDTKTETPDITKDKDDKIKNNNKKDDEVIDDETDENTDETENIDDIDDPFLNDVENNANTTNSDDVEDIIEDVTSGIDDSDDSDDSIEGIDDIGDDGLDDTVEGEFDPILGGTFTENDLSLVSVDDILSQEDLTPYQLLRLGCNNIIYGSIKLQKKVRADGNILFWVETKITVENIKEGTQFYKNSAYLTFGQDTTLNEFGPKKKDTEKIAFENFKDYLMNTVEESAINYLRYIKKAK